MSRVETFLSPPAVLLVGDVDHRDFCETVELLRASSGTVATAADSPELVVIAQSRPGLLSRRQIESLRRAAPLAGIVALLGSWCEGETRTGRPWTGVERFYWYEFPAWWRRQLARRALGRCPAWLRPEASRIAASDHRALGSPRRGRQELILIHSHQQDTAEALAETLHFGGYTIVAERDHRRCPLVRGASAGIWDGEQLDDAEAAELKRFVRRLNAHGARAIALLDFPRRERVNEATELGAAVVMGKPWNNHELIDTVQWLIAAPRSLRAA